MNKDTQARSDYDESLRKEVERVLQDPLFARSPVQSKLLQFLCDKAIEGDRDLTQFAIAVDGLGKPEDYDLHNDSYPRVQISRLRSNLANYYSRNAPLAASCIYVQPGDYRLRLAPLDKSYPSENRAAASPKAAPAHQPAPQPAHAPAASTAAAAHAALPPDVPFIRRHGFAFAAGATSLAAVGLMLGSQQLSSNIERGAPTIGLAVVADPAFESLSEGPSVKASVDRIARMQLSQSFVSNLAGAQGLEPGNSDYLVKIDLGRGYSNPEALITLINMDGEILYTSIVEYLGNREEFLREVSANLVYMVSPRGVVATQEIHEIKGSPRSGYQCFISIEASRGEGGGDTASQIDSCLERFPDDRFSAFWLARKAYQGFQQDIAKGTPISREAQSWSYVTDALRVDRHNAFANFVAAKVSAAEGDCDAAQVFIERAKERGTSYPTLIASTEVIGGGCDFADQATIESDNSAAAALIENNPAPDPLLHLYLMFVGLSIERPDLAELAAGRLVIENGAGPVQQTSELLRKSIEDQTFFIQNRKEVEDHIALFVWNDGARKNISTCLEQSPAERRQMARISAL